MSSLTSPLHRLPELVRAILRLLGLLQDLHRPQYYEHLNLIITARLHSKDIDLLALQATRNK